jgi:hypothetical protein
MAQAAGRPETPACDRGVMRDPEIRARVESGNSWRCGCGHVLTPEYVATLETSVAVVLEQHLGEAERYQATPLYCEACMKFVGWTAAPESDARMAAWRERRWFREARGMGLRYAAARVLRWWRR